MRAHESALITNPLTATSPIFYLLGGKYWFAVTGTFNSGTVVLNRVEVDGTYLQVGTNASQTSNGGCVLDLPPGAYIITLSTTGMSINAEVTRIPEE
jgi:hypothetical protein